MKIYDCFTYFDEKEILKIRLNEMNDVVDFFVIVEAAKTFTGISKPFYLDDCDEWVHEFYPKIIRLQITFPDSLESAWDREAFQRNALSDYFKSVDENDIVIISDVDEIINPSVVATLHEYDMPVQLDNSQYFWCFNWKVPDHCNEGARPVAVRVKDLKFRTPQQLREANLNRIPKAGWHFSYFSSLEMIIKKIESFSHTEYNSDEYKSIENILYRINNGIDPFDRFPLKYYDIDETYPRFVQQMIGDLNG
jgi:beta-1,4-mannosyl-glycoprotein beta-1,4-N-acetylglucosaminyltransferase